MLNNSRVRLDGAVDDLVDQHRQLVGPRHDELAIPGVRAIVRASHTDRQSTLLVRTDGQAIGAAWTVHDVNLEDLILAYLADSDTQASHTAWGVAA